MRDVLRSNTERIRNEKRAHAARRCMAWLGREKEGFEMKSGHMLHGATTPLHRKRCIATRGKNIRTEKRAHAARHDDRGMREGRRKARADLAEELGVGEAPLLASGGVALPEKGGLVGPGRQMAVHAVEAGVEPRPLEPPHVARLEGAAQQAPGLGEERQTLSGKRREKKMTG